jgi:ribosomal protein S4E
VWTFKTVSPYPGKHPCEKPTPVSILVRNRCRLWSTLSQ